MVAEAMHIALTGSTGFIGRNLLPRLLERGHRLSCLLRDPGAFGPGRAAMRIVAGGLDDAAALASLVAGADAVIHCAGAVRGADRAHFDAVNVAGTAHLVAAARDASVPRFLLLSSLAAREAHLSDYAASKRDSELELAGHAGPMAWAALRPPAVYGPGDKEMLPLFRVMAKGLLPVFGPPAARFSLLYVGDLVTAIECWLATEPPASGIFELHDGHSNGYGWDEIAATVSSLTGRRLHKLRAPRAVLAAIAAINAGAARMLDYAPMLTPGKLRELSFSDWTCDNEAIHAAIGWTPKVDLAAGLASTPGWR